MFSSPSPSTGARKAAIRKYTRIAKHLPSRPSEVEGSAFARPPPPRLRKTAISAILRSWEKCGRAFRSTPAWLRRPYNQV